MDRRWQWLVASVWNGLNVCALTDEVLDGLWEYPSHLVEIGNKNFQLMVKEVEDALITPQHKLRFQLSLLAYICILLSSWRYVVTHHL
jgi:hypothetical protein